MSSERIEDIRKIGLYNIVRNYVRFVHFVGPIVVDKSGSRSISASISTKDGVACTLVAVNADIEHFIQNVKPYKIMYFENLITVPQMGNVGVFYGVIELLPFDLLLNKDAIVGEHGDVDIYRATVIEWKVHDDAV